MSEPPVIRPADAATRARLRALHEEPLPREEFRRRYPTPGERLAWARRAQKRWLGDRRQG